MDIIFSANNNEEIKVMPVMPENLPEVSISYNNITMSTIYGELNLIGSKGLRELSLSSFFPCRQYPFMRPKSTTDWQSYVSFFQRWANNKKPIRIVIVDDNKEILNMAVTVNSFKWFIKKNKDVEYTVDLKEYVFVKVRRLSQ